VSAEGVEIRYEYVVVIGVGHDRSHKRLVNLDNNINRSVAAGVDSLH